MPQRRQSRQELSDLIDEIQLVPLIRERLADSAAGRDLTLEEVADSLGIKIEERDTGPSGGHEPGGTWAGRT
ncbi:hypothetical protein FHR32_001185 [Streptosporangium album]|uniref:Uncharacterized protein n=1 Tax=Streptosporangium album TaxID=47479 RepID=A0A7W7RRP5_9ACTN|nr:hypothetical protein [Streptosporangium album]MBB4936880.1 hypothetical protein [Streptosporangium album]